MGKEDAKTDVRNVDVLLPGQKNLLNRILKFLGPEIGEGLEIPEDIGQVPGATDLQQQAFDAAAEFGGGRLGGIRDAIIERMVAPPESRAQFDQEVFAPTMRDFFRKGGVVSQLQERYGTTSATSGALARGIGQGVENLGTNLGAQRAVYAREDERDYRNRLPTAFGLATAEETNPLSIAASLGAAERQILAQQEAGELERFYAQQPGANPNLSLLPMALGTRAFTPTIQQTAGKPGYGPLIGAGIGGAIGTYFGNPMLGAQLGGLGGGLVGGLV